MDNTKTKTRLVILFSKDADPLPDHVCEEILTRTYKESKKTCQTIHTCNEVLITTARTLIAEGKLPHDEVQFTFMLNNEIINLGYCNEIGQLPSLPIEICTYDNLLDRILEKIFNKKGEYIN